MQGMPITDAQITEENYDKFTNQQKEATFLLEKTASRLLPKEYDHAGTLAIHFFKRISPISAGSDQIEIVCQRVMGEQANDHDRSMLKSAIDKLLGYFQKYTQVRNEKAN